MENLGTLASFFLKINYRLWWVKLRDPAEHERLRALVEDEQSKRRKKPRKLKRVKRNGPK
jgi:hypothetical protein